MAEELYILEWSHRTGNLNVQPLRRLLSVNRNAYAVDKERTVRTKPKQATYNPNAPRIGPGVYRLSDIRDRCRIDPITDCWVWSMAVSNRGLTYSSKTPRVSLPKGVLSVEHRTVSVPRVSWLMSGRKLAPGHVVWRTCGCELCVNPAHLRAGTKADEGAWMRESGHRRGSLLRTAVNTRNAAAAQAIRPETVRAIEQQLAAGRLQIEVSADFGIHKATISKITRGLHVHQRGGGCQVRGASVFALAEVRA